MSLGNRFLALGLMVLVVGCFETEMTEGPGNAAFVVNDPPTEALQDMLYEFNLGAGFANAEITAENLPAWATLDSAKGVLSGVPTRAGLHAGIQISIKNGGEIKKIGPFDLRVVGDPYSEAAWHLGNAGQNTYARTAGTAGEDLKAADALRLGYTGRGVKVAISDTGSEIAHEDLVENILPNGSKDYSLPAPYFGDPTTKADQSHGTAVMGIVGARAWNGIGARGIAPEASVAGLNFIEFQSAASYVDQAGGDYDIFNQSWGPGVAEGDPVNYVPYFFNPATYRAQIRNGVTALRGGKGAIYVRAAGNDYYHTIVSQAPFVWRSRSACMEEDNSNDKVIVVGAMNAVGKKSSYSSTGACLWISGTGGEYGYNNPGFNATANSPAIFTTDPSGCDKGYSNTSAAANDFERGQLGNANCNYTTVMNGTSSASPSVAGVVALMLQANPALTYRDVRHILASTATQVDVNFTPFVHALDPAGYVNEPGWLTNAAGYKFHNWYGFGRANAKRAVEMAKTYVSNLGTLKDSLNADGSYKRTSGVISVAIPDNQPNAFITNTLAVTEAYKVEAVAVEVSITHPFTGDLGLELVSPSGTSSILLNTNTALNTANLAGAVLVSNAFYGEDSAGNWTLRVRDARAGNTGRLVNWKINVIGH